MITTDEKKNTEKSKKELTGDSALLNTYIEQIEQKAFELQFGNLILGLKVRNGQVKEVLVLDKQEKLRPF